MKVSVIIPTYNSEEFIDRSLISVINQSYFDTEVIVVDNYSTDRTKEKALRFADKFYECGPERTTQANYGISKATGELIYLTGSDMTRDYDFIKEAVAKIEEGYDAVYMSVKTDCDVNHFWGKVKALERETYIGTYIESARFFKKSVWEALNGFNEKMISTEEDFQHRLDYVGYYTGRIEEREYHLHEDDTLKKVFSKAFYYGKFMRPYLKKHKQRGWKQLNPIRPNLKLFLKHPILLGGFIIYKIVQYVGGLFGMMYENRISSS
jgi:glycosyltransferase involved in cell wall biosynthesis